MKLTAHSDWGDALVSASQLRADLLGSSALAKACEDYPFDYALKLLSGEVIRFWKAEIIRPGWIHLDLLPLDHQPEKDCLPFTGRQGIDIRIDQIVWVMDAPEERGAQ